MTETAIDAKQAGRLRRRARGGEPASAVGPLPRITPVKPQPKDPPFIWRWRDIEPFPHRAVAEVSIDDVERRALILVNPAFGGETVTTSTLIARLHRARSGRPRAAAPPHLRGDPLRDPRRGRRHHRQRPPLRHEGGRSDPHAADVLARPYQRERPPHHLVRRRQHSADPRGSTPISSSRAIRRPTISGRSTKATRSCGPRPAWSAPMCDAARGAFAEISLFRRGDAADAGGAAGRARRRAHGALHQSGDRRRGDADARLLCDAAAEGRADAAEARRPAT